MWEQIGRALQMFAQGLTDEQALEVAAIFPKYVIGKTYKAGEILTCGENGVGDPQLYKVISDHTSQEDWKPNETPALYTPIGLTDKGYPIWSKPTGSHDAYNVGDIVDYNGTLYECLIVGNVYSPEEYQAGWKIVE
jgi:hypothetical protein